MDNEWKNSLRERFSDYSAPEPEGLWEGIEQGLAEKKRRKMFPVWLVSGLAAAAAVALVVFLRPEKTVEAPVDTIERYVQDLTPDTSDASTSSASEDVAESAGVESVAESADATGSKPASFAVVSRRTLLAEAMPVETTDSASETHPERLPDDIDELEDAAVKGHSEPENRPDEVPVEVKEESIVSETNIKTDPETPSSMELMSEQKHKRFSVGAFRFGGQEASEQSQGFGLSRSKGFYRTRSTGKGQKQDTGSLLEMLSSNKASSYEAHHGAPVRVGVTFAWEMTPHLSLASGLNWTALNSTFEETAGDMRNYTRQDLGYLGVPLRLEAGFQPWKGLRLYAGAGGMVEQGILSKSVTTSYIGEYLEDAVSHHPKTGGLLWSVGASAGAEYRINRVFSLYFAPGIEYHFDNGSGVKSAYTEKPLHWNAAFGVRFNFQK